MSESMSADVLTTEVPSVGNDAVTEILRDFYSLDGELTVLNGERDRNFCLSCADGKRYMARFINPAEGMMEVDFQTKLLLHVADRNSELPVPRVIKSFDHGYQPQVTINGQTLSLRVVSYLSGKPQHLVSNTPLLMDSMGKTLGQLNCSLKGFSHSGASRELLWDITHPERIETILVDIKQKDMRSLIENVLDNYDQRVRPWLHSLPYQVIHNDLNPHNVLVSADGAEVCGIIDFGDALWAPKINDLATALSYQLTDGSDPLSLVRPFITSFRRECELCDDELRVLPDLIATRLILTLTISAWRAKRYPNNRDYILRNVDRAWKNLTGFTTLPYEHISEQLQLAAQKGASYA